MKSEARTQAGRPPQGRGTSRAWFLVAVLALVVATSGATAFAAATITTKDLANGAVTSPKIRDGGVHRADLGSDVVNSGKIADGSVRRADLASSARAPGLLGAQVDSDGSVLIDFGGIASVERFNQAEYYEYVVTFDRDVSSCLTTATGLDHPAVSWHEAAQNNPNIVYVHLADESGSGFWPASPFTVLVVCPA